MTDIKNVEAAALQIVLEPINAALTNIQNNPTTLNAAAQFTALQASFITNLPALEALGIKDSALILQEKLNGYVASLLAPVPVPTTPEPAPAATPAAPEPAPVITEEPAAQPVAAPVLSPLEQARARLQGSANGVTGTTN